MSDIHGCYDEYSRMLDKIHFSEKDRLYLAGDYIDRGKDSPAMLRWPEKRPSNVFPIKGNHDVFRYYDREKDCIFYDIDCGCVYCEVEPSATLACIRLEDEEIFYYT